MRKKQVNQSNLLEIEKKFKAKDNQEYKVKSMIDSIVYGKEIENQLPDLYYLVLWKNYLKKENIWEPLIVVIYF